ncbi:MAG TPA: hypothetical protein VMM93_12625 [Vicinamibacterales bacterium]|nr:hypothetical protein [Vicinamibacterales bacterium]
MPSSPASATSALGAKPGSGSKPGTATFSCNPGDGLCASGPLSGVLNGNGEMSIANVQAAMTLNFNGQNPDNVSALDRVDCTLGPPSTCLWSAWDGDADSMSGADFVDFDIQNNTLNASGSSEQSGGLLGMSLNVVHKARFNMTISRPGQSIFWRFNYNPNIPTTGGADLADVERTATCTWVFRAMGGQRAALSALVKPPKGKQYVHHEGTYNMPFTLTFNVPTCAS